MRTARFHYPLPRSAIAQEPIEPRDAARLLDTTRLADLRFRELPALLRPEDLVVVNRTRVRAARLRGRKVPTGGEVEILLLSRRDEERWDALVRPSRRLRAGVRLDFGPLLGWLVTDPEEGEAVIGLRGRAGEDPEDLLPGVGELPLPPYMRGSLEDPERYQTIFAKDPGSAAAPTAGLHFTPSVLEGLADRGIELAEVDLEVGLDTFRPIGEARVEDHRIHRERFVIPEQTVAAVAGARRRGGRVVAIGTTVVRALESGAIRSGRIRSGGGRTGLFIVPGYRFRVVDALVTNFHVPGSTLTVMVEAFMGASWRKAYAHALARGYRFLSFGDAMWAERQERPPPPRDGGRGDRDSRREHT